MEWKDHDWFVWIVLCVCISAGLLSFILEVDAEQTVATKNDILCELKISMGEETLICHNLVTGERLEINPITFR
ncbi:unnamed protein product, partial [marine sediment metagenome]